MSAPMLFYAVGEAEINGKQCVSITVFNNKQEGNTIILKTESCENLIRMLVLTLDSIKADDENDF